MLDRDAVAHAVMIQGLAYQLLEWVESGIDRGFLHIEAVQVFASNAALTEAWMREHWSEFPVEARPDREHLPSFARFFSTFLESSHVLEKAPASKFAPDWCGCTCPVCATLAQLPHVQPRKLDSTDKHSAKRLEHRAIEQLTLEQGVGKESIEALTADPELRAERALVAYGHELLSRLDGNTSGAANLALWRRFAWKPEGSPKKNFKFSAQLVFDAEEKLVAAAIRAAAVR